MDKQSNSEQSYNVSWLPRCRWNVLDLIRVVGRGSVPTYLFSEVDMSWAERLRSQLAKRGHKTTVTAIIIKAIAVAQIKHPASRTARLPWGRTVTFQQIVAGFTVEKFVGSEPAVFLGSIKDPHLKTLEQISRELRSYAECQVTEIPQLEIEDRFSRMPWLVRQIILWLGLSHPWIRLRYMGATFGLSSLGKYGMRSIIPPCVSTSTFGVGAVEDRPVVRDGQIVIRPMLTVTLNFDHRVIDGAPAARFLNDVCKLLEGRLAEYLIEDEEASAEQASLISPLSEPIGVN